MDQSSNEVSPPVAGQFALPLRATFGIGRSRTQEIWRRLAGSSCRLVLRKTDPEGYAVESESHPGSVQIYPVAALEHVA